MGKPTLVSVQPLRLLGTLLVETTTCVPGRTLARWRGSAATRRSNPGTLSAPPAPIVFDTVIGADVIFTCETTRAAAFWLSPADLVPVEQGGGREQHLAHRHHAGARHAARRAVREAAVDGGPIGLHDVVGADHRYVADERGRLASRPAAAVIGASCTVRNDGQSPSRHVKSRLHDDWWIRLAGRTRSRSAERRGSCTSPAL